MSGFKLSEENHAPQSESQEAPLGFTVHSLPVPREALQADANRTRMGRWKMLFVLLICASPVIASYWTYYVIRPEGRRNYGELIEPQRPLPLSQTVSLTGQTAPLTALKGQWLLISVAGADCDHDCQQRLYFQRQLRETLGKDKDRLDPVWLIQDEAALAPTLASAVSAFTVLRMQAADLQAWLPPSEGHALQSHLYLVDPLGNLMMRFPADMDMMGANKAKRDLERLLRAAAFWDTPGR